MKKFLRPAVFIWLVVWAVFAFLPLTPKITDESLRKGAETCGFSGGCDKKFDEYFRPFGFPASVFKLSYTKVNASCIKTSGFGLKTGCSEKSRVVLIPLNILTQLVIFLTGLILVLRFSKRESIS